MSNIVRWDPFGDWLAVQRAMDRMMTPWTAPEWAANIETALDMYETDEAVVIKLSVPGWKPEDIQVSITGDTLTLKGETHTENEHKDATRTYIRRERRSGSFQRVITLPGSLNADGAVAEFENGLLTLTVPKAEEAKARTIQVKSK